jgi:hypothetical protein
MHAEHPFIAVLSVLVMGKPLRLFEELLTITAFVSLKVLVVNPSGLLLYAHKVTNYIQTETYPHICMCRV